MLKIVCVILLWSCHGIPVQAKGQPVTTATSETWPCNWPYEQGLCSNRKVKDK